MKTHIIQWKSMTNGVSGIGTKLFEKDEADRLVRELNERYPDIIHESVLQVVAAPEALVEVAA
jgi:hypothetical protein